MKRPYNRRRPEVDAEAALMESTRPDPRPELRADLRVDSRAAAEARTRELLDHGALDVDTTDKFRVDRRIIPDGWDYEWKRRSVYNEEDPSYQVNLTATGWTPVPLERHPEFMPEGHKGNMIDRDGLVLMERPEMITTMIRERDHQNALAPVRNMEATLSGVAPGTFERVDARGKSTVKVGKSYEAMPIPE